MEKVFVYGFPGFFVSLWLVLGLRRKGGPGAGALMLQLVPAVIVEGMILLDACLSTDGIPVPLLAADLLFLDAVVLQMAGPLSGRVVFPFPAILLALAGLLRSVMELSGLSVPLGSVAYMVLCAGILLLYAVLADVFRMKAGQGAMALGKLACAQAQGFVALAVLVAGSYDTAVSRGVSLVVSLLLVMLYVYLQLNVSLGPQALKSMPLPLSGTGRHQRAGPERVREESKRIDSLFERVEDYMQREKPYLDDMFSMTTLASEMMTNKSMLSKTINEKSGKHFCQYVNSYRIRHAVSLMKRDGRLKVGEISLMSGFHTVASFNLAFKLFMNDTPSEYMRTLHSEGLARKGAGEQ